MAGIAAPGGDDGPPSDQEVEVDILSPQHSVSDSGDAREPKPLQISFPYQPTLRLLGEYESDSFEINKLQTSQEFEEFLANRGSSHTSALTASIKYAPGVCDELIDKVKAYRIFQLKSRWLLWFHMSLSETSAVVPETDLEVVMVNSYKDLNDLQPSGRAHCYALVQDWRQPKEGNWTVISLSQGFPSAFQRLNKFIKATEIRVKASFELLPDAGKMKDVMSGEELEKFTKLTEKDVMSYVRNPKNLVELRPILDPVVDRSPLFRLSLTRLQPSSTLWTSKRTQSFGSFSPLANTTLHWELHTGTSPKEPHYRKIGKLLPLHDSIVCLRFPEAKEHACKRLERIINLLLSFLYTYRGEKYAYAFRLLQVKYLRDDSSAIILISFNFSSLFHLFHLAKSNSGFNLETFTILRALKSTWLLPPNQAIHRVFLQVQEPLKEGYSEKYQCAGLKLEVEVSGNEVWTEYNAGYKRLQEFKGGVEVEREIEREKAKKIWKKCFGWLNKCRGGSRQKKAMAVHIFGMLEDVVASDELHLDVSGPGFYGEGKAVVKDLLALCSLLKFPKEIA